jgi:twinkle protein
VPTFSTGWDTLDRHLRIFAGEFMVVTGIPGHGKSTWALNLVVNLGERYGWRCAIFSPEMPTVPHLRDKLRRIILRHKPLALDRQAIDRADTWIDRMLVFIDADPTGRVDEDFDLEWILDRATDGVLRDGIRLFVIDPWNEVEHARKGSESMTDYIGRSIRSIKRFAQQYQVAVIVIAHPTKDVAKEGKNRAVSLYDIEGSAHWFNKCDHGVVVDRPKPEEDEALIRVAKVRFEESGERGSVRLRFDRESARFDVLMPELDEVAA